MPKSPFVRGKMTASNYLLTILLATIKKQGGELRLKKADFVDIEEGQGLVKFIDDKKGELVLRFGEENSEIFFIAEDDAAWATNSRNASQTTQSPLSTPSLQRSGMMTKLSVDQMMGKTPMAPPELAQQPIQQPQPVQRRPIYRPPPPADAAAGYSPSRLMPPHDPDQPMQQLEMDDPEMEMEMEPPPQEDYRMETTEGTMGVPIPTVHLPSQPSSRRAVIDDMKIFLMRQDQQQKAAKRTKTRNMEISNRDGLLPFRVKKGR